MELYAILTITSVLLLLPMLLYVCGVLKDPFHPSIFVGALTFGVTCWHIWLSGPKTLGFLEEGDLVFLLLITVMCMAGYHIGWYLHRWRNKDRVPRVTTDVPTFDAQKILMCAFAIEAISVPIYLATRDDVSITGYVREFGALWCVAAMLSVQAFAFSPTTRIPAVITFCISLIPPLDRFLVYGQRGDTFRMAIILLPFFLFRGTRPLRSVFIPVALGLAMILGTLERTRAIMGEDDRTSRIEAMFAAIPKFFDRQGEHFIGGDTHIFGAAIIYTARDTGAYDYGAYLYNIGVKFLPKEFFDKEALYTNWYPTNWAKFTSENVGYDVPFGAAPTGIAHSFVEFSWGACVFWMLYGYWAHARYTRALAASDIRQHGYLTAFFVVSLYLISQDLYAFTMNTIYLFPALAFSYRFARVNQPLDVPARALPVGTS